MRPRPIKWRSTKARVSPWRISDGQLSRSGPEMGYGSERDSFATLIGHWRTGHRMASRGDEPGALLLFTFIGQSRFDEIGCRARRSAAPLDCPCSSSSQELRVARFGIAEDVPWIIPVRA
jgi:hypothetical protein